MADTVSTPVVDTHVTRNARLGLIFFFIYAAVYAGFVAVCTFRYDWMGTIVFAGLNLAVVYGMGLIALAVVMAVIYLMLCKVDAPAASLASGEVKLATDEHR